MVEFLRKIFWHMEHSTGSFNMALEVLPPVFVTVLIYYIFRRIWHKRKFGAEFKTIRKTAFWNELIRLLLVGEIAAVVCIAVFPYAFWTELWHVILYPLSHNPNFNEGGIGDWRYVPYVVIWIENGRIFPSDFDDLVLNILFFVPLGLLSPLIMKKPALWKTVLIGFIFTLLVEASQMFTNHCSDINDIIANTLGAFFGYLLYLPIKAFFPKFIKKCGTSVKTDI